MVVQVLNARNIRDTLHDVWIEIPPYRGRMRGTIERYERTSVVTYPVLVSFADAADVQTSDPERIGGMVVFDAVWNDSSVHIWGVEGGEIRIENAGAEARFELGEAPVYRRGLFGFGRRKSLGALDYRG